MQHAPFVNSAEFSPDGQRVLTVALFDMTARLWDALSGRPIGEPMQHDGRVGSAQSSPDRQRIVTVFGNTVRLWDALSGKPIGEPMQHGGPVVSARFSPDGQRVMTASRDKTVRLWDVPSAIRKDSADDMLLLAELAEATGGVALRTSGQAEIWNVLSPEQVRVTRETIAAKFVGPYSNLTPLQRVLKWSLDYPNTRKISPLSDLTVPEWIKVSIKDGNLESLRGAIRIDPANTRLIAHFGLALANLAVAKETDPDKARRARAEADYQTHRALKLNPDNNEIRKIRDEVIKLLNLVSDREMTN